MSVEVDADGNLTRYLNSQITCSIPTDMKPQGVWYGAFEVSMSVSRVCLLYNDPLNAEYPSKVEAEKVGKSDCKELADILEK